MIEVLRDGNVVVVAVAGKVRSELERQASFVERRYLRGREYYEAKRAGRGPMQYHTWHLFTEDHKGRLVIPLGLWPRLSSFLRKANVPYQVKDLTKYPRPDAYCPDWSAVADFKFRAGQERALRLLAQHLCGRIACPAGWGKSFLIGAWCLCFRKAKFAIITRRVEVLAQRLYPYLAGLLPDVGMVGGGRKRYGRVTCYTAASLHHAPGDEDFVIFDEGHEAASDDCAAKMTRFRHAHMWGLSASWDMRLDGKDMRCEALFGPIRMTVSYEEAVTHRMVVPIVVQVEDVHMQYDPCWGLEDVHRERAAIWANRYRNELIAKDARLYGPDVQVLISVRTLEHGLRLKKLLPEFELVYNAESQEPGDWDWFYAQGLIDRNFQPLSLERREKLRRAFEAGRLKKVIATTIWNVGVDMRRLQVVIRADAGGSPINDIQIPGRGSRIYMVDGQEKRCAVVHDYLDQFNSAYAARARKRLRSYQAQGWTIVYPDRKDPQRLRQLASLAQADTG